MFEIIDLFGKNVVFNFNGRSQAKTAVGGIFSLCFFGYMVWSAYHVSQDMIFHKNPQTVTSEFFNENPDEMLITPDTFNFAFGVQNSSSFLHYIDDSIYTIEATQRRLERVPKTDGSVEVIYSNIPLVLERCTVEHFGDVGPQFAELELNQLFCFNLAQIKAGQVKVQGAFTSPISEYIKIAVKECDETKSTCAPKEKRRQLLEAGLFTVYFTNLATDTRNYSNPVFRFKDSTYTTFGTNYYRDATMFLSHEQVSSDLGWVIAEPELKKYIKYHSMKETFTLTPNLTEFFRFLVKAEKVTTTHKRSYMKIQDVLAVTNGLASVGLLAALIIVAPYSKIKFYERLINELFDVKILKKVPKNKKKRKSKDLDTLNSDRVPVKQNNLNVLSDEDQLTRRLQSEINRATSLNGVKLRQEMRSLESDDPDLESAKRNKELKGDTLLKTNSIKKGTVSVMSMDSVMADIEDKDNIISFKMDADELAKNQFKNDAVASDYNKNNLKNRRTKLKKNPSQSQREAQVQNRYINKKYQEDPIKDDDSKVQHTGKVAGSLFRSKPQKRQPQPKLIENYHNDGALLESLTLNHQPIAQTEVADENIVVNLPKMTTDDRKQTDQYEEENEIGKMEKGQKEDIDIDTPTVTRFGQRTRTFCQKEFSAIAGRDSMQMSFSFWEYIKAFVYKSPEYKDKMSVLNEGIRRIDERLDIISVFKKLREIDKLKVLLLENEQLVLFDGLPKPELVSKNLRSSTSSRSSSRILLQEPKFISEKKKNDLLVISYENVRRKPNNTMIDQKLLEIFDDIIGVQN